MASDGRREETRAKILEAALVQFARYGFSGATIRVAELADVAPPTVYWHFDTKSGLYAETVRVAGQRFLAAMRHESSGLSFAALAQRWLAAFERRADLTRLLRTPASDHSGGPMEAAADDLNQRLIDFWCDWLRERRGPEDAAGDRALASMVVATLSTLVGTRPADDDDMVARSLDNLARLIDVP